MATARQRPPPPEHWLQAFDALPGFGARTPWNAPSLRAIFKNMGRRKKPGLDGRYAGGLSLLPDGLLEL
eukprot:11181367-Lingulodinium_polyedra.AAC.1